MPSLKNEHPVLGMMLYIYYKYKIII